MGFILVIRSFDTEIDLLEFCHKNLTSDGTVYAVIFENLEKNTDDIPMGLNYTIRNFEKNVDWNTNSRFNVIAAEYIPNTGICLFKTTIHPSNLY